MSTESGEPVRLGVSSCLTGGNVRYDGGHKQNRYLCDTLAHHFEFVPICPEVECGMPTPREALRLVGDPQNPRLITTKSQKDYTETMQNWCYNQLEKVAGMDLHGYIFKSRSPSCGIERIQVYDTRGNPGRMGMGFWARMFTEHFPHIPLEDEGRLNDPKLREQFIEHVFV